METESQGTHHQGIQPQPQQQEQGPPNTLLDIYSFSAKKQPVQDAQVTGTDATQPKPAHQPESRSKESGQRQENPLLAEMTSRPEQTTGMTRATSMTAGTGAIQSQSQQPKPAHRPEPAYQAKESGQKERQDNPLLKEIIEPENPDEMQKFDE
jgi:hypothetical protein